MKVQALKQGITGILKKWGNQLIEGMAKEGGASFATPYLQRALNNIITRYESEITEKIDVVSLFIADEKGEVNAEAIVSDLSKALCNMKPKTYSFMGLTTKVGNGSVRIEFPQNPITEMFFGDYLAFVVTPADLEELAEIIVKHK